MRTLIAAAAATAGSVAFQASVALFPNTLRQYAWAVKYVWLVSGLLWLIWLISHPRVQEFLAGSAPASLSEKVNDRVSVQVNPEITSSPTFNNAPVFAPQIIVGPPHQTVAPALEINPPREQPKHNLVFLKAEFVKITYSGPGFSSSTDGMHSFSEVLGVSGGDMIGLVARFRNEALYGRDVRAIDKARAHLKLFDKSSQEIGTGFSAALWLGHSGDVFDLIPNGLGGSVLVCWGSKTKAKVSWKTRVAVNRLHDNEIALVNGYPKRAEVTILDSNDRPLLEPIILEITKTEGELSVVAKPLQP